MSRRKTRKQVAKRDQAGFGEPVSLSDQLGPGVRAWAFGAAATGSITSGNRLDVYVAGARAEKVEAEYYGRRPLIVYAGNVYAVRLMGPAKMSEDNFIKEHPEAVRIL